MPILSCKNIQHVGVIQINTTTSSASEYTSDITKIIIKRKIASESRYITIYQHDVANISDLTVELNDALCRNNTEYLYKVEYRNDSDVIVEYTSTTINSYFNCLVILDESKVYSCPMNCSAITFTSIKPYIMNVTLHNAKPSYYCNSAINYSEGTCQGTFVDMVEINNKIDFIYKDNWRYRANFKNWLMSGTAKLIKSVSGEMWLVGIKTDSISDSSLFSDAEIDGARLIEFGWVEIGDADSTDDLMEYNLLQSYSV